MRLLGYIFILCILYSSECYRRSSVYNFFFIISIAYTKYLIAFSSILVLNLKKLVEKQGAF